MEKNHLLVIGENGYWAKVPITANETADVKKARQKAHWPKVYKVYRVTEETYVSEYGSMRYPGDAIKDAPELVDHLSKP